MNNFETALHGNTYWEKINIVDRSFVIQRVKDIDPLLEVISDEEFNRDEHLPYWADLWPASVALSEYVIENKLEFRGKKILELGCGLGLVGIAVFSIGGHVLFTDNDSYALKFTKANFRRNFNRSPAVQLMDWRNPRSTHSFDIILAADILYEKRWLQPVLEILEINLLPQGTAYIAGPDRTVSRDIYEMIERRKWKRQSLMKETTINEKLHQIVIHRITKC